MYVECVHVRCDLCVVWYVQVLVSVGAHLFVWCICTHGQMKVRSLCQVSFLDFSQPLVSSCLICLSTELSMSRRPGPCISWKPFFLYPLVRGSRLSTGSLTEPKALQFSKPGWPMIFKHPPVSVLSPRWQHYRITSFWRLLELFLKLIWSNKKNQEEEV